MLSSRRRACCLHVQRGWQCPPSVILSYRYSQRTVSMPKHTGMSGMPLDAAVSINNGGQAAIHTVTASIRCHALHRQC